MRDTAAQTDPRVAVVIPVFRHAGLVPEAIESALAQETAFPILVVLVNDGCPFAETDEVGRAYARAYPDRVIYLRKPNGGLASARNHGIRSVLSRAPSVEAIYFLDADNRLRPHAIARAMDLLDSDPGADWIYPSIDMFGLDSGWDYSGPYSLLQHSEINICEAGSLVRRKVFESGVLFDEDFRLGWEDWDFFLAAARAGYRGRYGEDFGFRYRRRPESMLKDANRGAAQLRSQMESKHKSIFAPRTAVRLEAEEAPRYAVYMPDREEVLHCVDADRGDLRVLDVESHIRGVWKANILPTVHSSPPFTVVMTSAVMNCLRSSGLLHWTLWKLERLLLLPQLAGLRISQGPTGRLEISGIGKDGSNGSGLRQAAVIAIGPQLFRDVLNDDGTGWIDSIFSAHPSTRFEAVEVKLPASVADTDLLSHDAASSFLKLVHALRASPYRRANGQDWQWRESGSWMRNREYEIPRRRFGGHPVFPRVTDTSTRNMGFLLPMAEFAGVERVAYNIAKAMKARGWSTHAMILDTGSINLLSDWEDAFDSVGFLSDPDFCLGGNAQESFLGTEISDWGVSGDHNPVLSMLSWLDCAINFHGGAVAGAMGQLRQFGVRTVNSLHVHDLTRAGRPTGNTHVGLAYEHAFDLFAPCSEAMATWLHSMGVPKHKIVTVPNAPGFDLPAASIDADPLAERLARADDEALKVLFIGRLDRQKGVDRLDALIRATKESGLPVDWRVIGGSVMGDLPDLPYGQLAVAPEAPRSDPAELAAAYGWADVVILLSRYEGLPLTVLEAMRAGAVVVATDVGATSEAVRDGKTGFLIPNSDGLAPALEALSLLAGDRDRLRAMSKASLADSQARNWHTATQALSDALDRS